MTFDPAAFYESRGLNAERIAQAAPHGTRARYIAGRCRCMLCRASNARYAQARAQAKRRGETDRVVPSGVALAHLLELRRHGVGKRAVRDAASVSYSTIYRILHGKRCRESAIRRILALDAWAISAGAVASARITAETRRRIALLVEEGYTKGFIARALGAKSRNLQIAKPGTRVLARTAANVERLYTRLVEVPA